MRYDTASILIYNGDSPPPSDFRSIDLVVQLHDDGSGHVVRDRHSADSPPDRISPGTVARLLAERLGTPVQIAGEDREKLRRAGQLAQILMRALRDAWWLEAAAAYAELAQMFPEQTLDPADPQD